MRTVRSLRRLSAVWTTLLALLAVFLAPPAMAATGKTFTVNTTDDAHDAAPGNGACADTIDGKCSLRAAIEEANATGAPDTIKLPSGTYDLTIAELISFEPLTIVGAGSGSTFVDGTNSFGVFDISMSGTSISGLTIQHGNVADGAGVYVGPNAALTLRNAAVKDNTASDLGGGIYNNGSITMTQVVLQDNTSGVGGGGLYNLVGAHLSSVKVIHNSVTGDNGEGGGLWNESGSMSVTRSRVFNNFLTGSSVAGAGISNDGSMVLSWSWVKGSTCASCEGAGIDNDGEASITQSAISGNSIGGGNYGGGGLATDGPTYLTNDTIYGNHSDMEAGGIEAWGYTVLVNVTVTHNEAESNGSGGSLGGGVVGEASGALQIRNSIVGANLFGATGGDPNCYDSGPPATINSLGHNVFGPITGCPAGDFLSSDKKNVTDSALKLGSFGIHGGPTPTVPLLAGSPALKLGTNCPTIDQRGVKRPKNGCDAGAFEKTAA